MISVLIPTFCRTNLLNEALQCYLNQDVACETELVILNDFEAQTLVFDHPRVRIINETVRRPIGEKRNQLLSLAKYPWVNWWDDDDIFLNFRLSICFNAITSKRCRLVREQRQWNLKNGSLSLGDAYPFGPTLTQKSAIEQAGGFPSNERFADKILFNNMIRAGFFLHEPVINSMPSTIHRFNIPNYSHVTDFSEDCNNQNRIQAIRRLTLGIEPEGKVVLNPALKADYQKMCEEAYA